MEVPDYQSLMLPLLELLGDEKEHTVRDVREKLAAHYGIDQEDRSPRSAAVLFYKRISWATTSSKNAGLLEKSSMGITRITSKGLEVLNRRPNRIDNDYLAQFPGFMIFNKGRDSSGPGREEPGIELTPFELLENNYQILKDQLAHDLLEQVYAGSPAFFEKMVVDLLLAMGYGGSLKDAGEAIGQSNDEGIDGYIKEDRLGLDVIYIQAKRWRNQVGRREIQGFVGSLAGKRARKGIFITTSHFTKTATEYVRSIENRVILIDGLQLAQHMIDCGVGVTELSNYSIKRIDSDYFTED